MGQPAQAIESTVVAPPPVVDRDPGAVIACELPCIHCGYDLRTMRLDAQCPECGKMCVNSMAALAVARPTDLARTRRGVVMLILAALVPLFLVGCAVMFLVLDLLGAQMRWMDGDAVPWIIGLGCGVAGPVLAAAGMFRVTFPVRPLVDTDVPSPHPGRMARKALRYLACAYAAASIAGCVFSLVMAEVYTRGEWLGWCVALTLSATAHAWTVRNILACRYMARVVQLGDAPRLARWLRVLSWYAAAMCGYVVLFSTSVLMLYLFRQHLERMDMNPSSRLLSILMFASSVLPGIMGFGMLVWGIAWLVSLTLVVRCVRRAERTVAAHGGKVFGPAAATGASPEVRAVPTV